MFVLKEKSIHVAKADLKRYADIEGQVTGQLMDWSIGSSTAYLVLDTIYTCALHIFIVVYCNEFHIYTTCTC